MDVEQLYKFIENPALLNDDSLQEIRKLVTQYPYFQTAHILYLKNLHNIDAGKYERQVKISGIQVNDRRRFYHLLFDEDFQEKHENEVEPKKETKEKENLKKKTKNDIGENISGVISQQIESSHEKKEIDDVIEYNTQSVVDPDSKKYKNEYDDKDSFSISEEEDGGSPVKEDENLKDEELSRSQDNDLLELDDDNKGGKKNNLIDKFMKKEGESLKIKIDEDKKEENEDLSQDSTRQSEEIMTETLAEIYVKQGIKKKKTNLFDKAIDVYNKLSLKYPEKSAYFADQINNVNKLKNNK